MCRREQSAKLTAGTIKTMYMSSEKIAFANGYFSFIRDDSTLFTKIRRLTPLYGSTESFLAALQEYKGAVLRSEAEAVQAARVKGLTVIFDSLIELGLFSSLLAPLRLSRGFWTSLYAGRVLRSLSLPELDLTQALASKILEQEKAQNSLDLIFNSVSDGLVKSVVSEAKG